MIDNTAATPVATMPPGTASVRAAGYTCELNAPLPSRFISGAGAILVIKGRCFHDAGSIRDLSIGAGVETSGILQENELVAEPQSDRWGMRFWCEVTLDGSCSNRLALTLHARAAGVDPVDVALGVIEVDPARPRPPAPRTDGHPLIAICLATYKPDMDKLRRQIDSLREQTYANWRCIISDDASGPDWVQGIRRLCAADPRFRILENARNRGFYRNFEHLLEHIPEDAAYVALCDQDDRWYPEKLSRLHQAFDAATCLVYSDMRIVDGSDQHVISDTYWRGRTNNHTDLTLLLLANTITGAACLFRVDLLRYILPFPERIGDAFHDHWIGCVALSSGGIKYVDAPLYDYYQYPGNVIGHCDFVKLGIRDRARILGVWLRKLGAPRAFKQKLVKSWLSSLAVYAYECRRIRVIAKTIRLRVAVPDRNKRRALNIFGAGLAPGFKLLLVHARVLLGNHTTDDAELRLAAGYFAWWLNRWRQRIVLRKSAPKLT